MGSDKNAQFTLILISHTFIVPGYGSLCSERFRIHFVRLAATISNVHEMFCEAARLLMISVGVLLVRMQRGKGYLSSVGIPGLSKDAESL